MVVSLVVVGVVTGVIGSSGDVSTTQSKLFWQSQPLGVSDSGVDGSGDTFFVVTNNTGEDITLVGYTANGVERDFTVTTPLIPRGEKRVIFIARQNACVGEVCSLSNLSFKYISSSGLDKVSNGNDLLVEKQDDVSIAMFTSQQTLVCVNNGDVGQCGNGGSNVSMLNDLNDVIISTPQAGQTLVYRSDGNWINSNSVDTNWQTSWSTLDSNLNSTYLKLNTSNGALTGDLNLFKASPSLVLTSSDNSAYSSILSRSATNGAMTLKNWVGTPSGTPVAMQVIAGQTLTTRNNSKFSFAKTQPFTIEFWLNPGITHYGYLVDRFIDQATTKGFFVDIISANASSGTGLQFGLTDGTNTFKLYNWFMGLNAGTWYYITLINDGSGNLSVYVNNSLQSMTTGGTYASVGDTTTGTGLNVYGENDFKPQVDELVIWNIALDSTARSARYNATSGLYASSTANTVAIYHFDNTITDNVSSPANFSGTNTYVSGKVLAPPAPQLGTILQYQDATGSGERGIAYIGDQSSRTVLQGQTQQFWTNYTQRATITNDGNVGIGTTTPINKLNVVGDLNVTGNVSFPGQSYVYAYRTAAQTVNASTDTNMIYDTEGVDTLGEYNPTTGTFVARSAGKYLVTATNLWSNTDAGIQYRTHIFKSATKHTSVLDSMASSFLTQTASATLDLAAGNTIYIQVWQNSSGAESIFSDGQRWTSLTIVKVA